jgi:hypothetical protein
VVLVIRQQRVADPGLRPQMSVSRRLFLACVGSAVVSWGCAPRQAAEGRTPYEALLAHIGGLDRPYVVRAEPAKPTLVSTELAGYELATDGQAHELAAFGKAQVLLLGNIEIASMFSDGCDGWAKFHSKYPRAGALLRLSRIARAKFGHRIAIYTEISSACLGGQGSVFYLEPSGNGWGVADIKSVWVS